MYCEFARNIGEDQLQRIKQLEEDPRADHRGVLVP